MFCCQNKQIFYKCIGIIEHLNSLHPVIISQYHFLPIFVFDRFGILVCLLGREFLLLTNNSLICFSIRKYIECSMCRFATSCSTAYATHMMGFHSGRLTNVSINIPTEKPMEEPMYCLCGFGSSFGNRIGKMVFFLSL